MSKNVTNPVDSCKSSVVPIRHGWGAKATTAFLTYELFAPDESHPFTFVRAAFTDPCTSPTRALPGRKCNRIVPLPQGVVDDAINLRVGGVPCRLPEKPTGKMSSEERFYGLTALALHITEHLRGR